MKAEIVVVGSLNADYVINLHKFPAPGETVIGKGFEIFPGGKGANQAFAAARLGGSVAMVGQVGDDLHAGELIRNLESAGVDTSYLQRDATVASGLAFIYIDGEGQNQIIIVPGANGTFAAERLSVCHELIEGARIVLLQLEIPLATVLAAARLAKRNRDSIVILDPAPALDIPDELLSLADYVTPNETELALLTCDEYEGGLDRAGAAQLARRLLARGANRVIVKLGSQGALLVGNDQEHFWPPMPVTAVDTTAAGDAFNAAFAVSLAAGKNEVEAGEFAAAAAALSVTRKGAQPSMPTLQEIDFSFGDLTA
ncbi:MAG: ribokinase [Blastocatellia bacterium]|nr:ribokinase [Blastocatellia bacterium]